MFFDCVVDENSMPIFNDSPDKVKKYVQEYQPFPEGYRVYDGMLNRIVTIAEYLKRARGD